jgi:hypothetical protein
MFLRRFGLLVISATLLSAGCTGSRLGETNPLVWSDARPDPVLVSGAQVRTRYRQYVSPCLEDVFVVHRGTYVKTFAELQPLVRPIDSPEAALAYRYLLQRVEIERDETLEALAQTTPLDFYAGERAVYGKYVAGDAARWGVPHEPAVETVKGAIVITRPSFRPEGLVEDARVELVRETFHRDGNYQRAVVRVLERGKEALVYQPPPLL